MIVNFKRFPIFTSLKKDMVAEIDAQELVANTLYMQGQGLGMHALAMKIYNTDGEVELSDKDIETFQSAVPIFSPVFIDSLNDYINKHKSNG